MQLNQQLSSTQQSQKWPSDKIYDQKDLTEDLDQQQLSNRVYHNVIITEQEVNQNQSESIEIQKSEEKIQSGLQQEQLVQYESQEYNKNIISKQEQNQIQIQQESKEYNNNIISNQQSSQIQIQFDQQEQSNDIQSKQEQRQIENDLFVINEEQDFANLCQQIEDRLKSLKQNEFFHIRIKFVKSEQILFLQGCLDKSEKYLQMQISLMQNSESLIQIIDQTFTLNNMCLNQNSDLKIGSFSYCIQTNQIIYQIKIMKTEQMNRVIIEQILQNVNQNFYKIHLQILKFGFKIQDVSVTTLKQNFYESEKKQSKMSNLINFSFTSEDGMKKEFDQIYMDAQQGNDNVPVIKLHQEKQKQQIIPLGYFISKQLSHLSDQDIIEEGGFHKIFDVNLKVNEDKTLNLAYKTGQNDKLNKEIQFIIYTISKSYSKYLVQIYTHKQEGRDYFYFMERCHFKSLRNYQKKYQYVMSLSTKMKILRQIAKGLCHLHQHQVCHLDIKPDNILVDKEGNAKICDFGEAFHPDYQFQRDCIKFSVPYSAPELLLHKCKNITTKADVFSFGLLAYEVCFGKIPLYFLNKEQYLLKYKNQQYDIEDENQGLHDDGTRTITLHIISFVHKCLRSKEKERPTIQSIYNYLKLLKYKFNSKLNEKIQDQDFQQI